MKPTSCPDVVVRLIPFIAIAVVAVLLSSRSNHMLISAASPRVPDALFLRARGVLLLAEAVRLRPPPPHPGSGEEARAGVGLVPAAPT